MFYLTLVKISPIIIEAIANVPIEMCLDVPKIEYTRVG